MSVVTKDILDIVQTSSAGVVRNASISLLVRMCSPLLFNKSKATTSCVATQKDTPTPQKLISAIMKELVSLIR